jgi:lipoprotein-releasing system permease protein
VFLLQGGLFGFGGAAAGSLLGAVALLMWQMFVRNPDGTPLFPLALEPSLFAAGLAGAAATGLAAAFAPALRAARLDPAVAIRG